MKCHAGTVLVTLALAVSAVNGNFVDRVKCKGCLSLAPVAGSKVCNSKCKEKNIFPGTCSKICRWMIARHPETVCRIAKLCTLNTIKELKSGGLLSALGFDEAEGYNSPVLEPALDLWEPSDIDDDFADPLLDMEGEDLFDETRDWSRPRRLRRVPVW